MRTELNVERWSEAGAELEGLFVEHLRELGGGELELNSRLCEAMDSAEVLLMVVAREQQKIVGYCIWTIGETLEHRGELVAELKPWYVVPEKRGGALAMKLLRRSLKELRARKVTRVLLHHWGNEKLGELFVRLGARPLEWVFELKLES